MLKIQKVIMDKLGISIAETHNNELQCGKDQADRL